MLILLKGFSGLHQTCDFNSETWYLDSHDSEKLGIFWTCNIRNVKLLDDKEKVTTGIKNNTKSIDAVVGLEYYGEDIKFIPVSIFSIFKSMEYFKITDGLEFEHMKAEYLQNATKLRIFKIVENKMIRLDENLFLGAPNLEYINFSYNLIEQIHRWTFKGLFKLLGLFLEGNNIMILHPRTFSHLIKLRDLELKDNTCIDKKYLEIQNNFAAIENDLQISCKFENIPGEELAPVTNTDNDHIQIEYYFVDVVQNEIDSKNNSATLDKPKIADGTSELSQDDADLIQLKKDLTQMNTDIDVLHQKMAGSENMIKILQKRKDATADMKRFAGKLSRIEEGFDDRLDDITRDITDKSIKSRTSVKILEKSIESCEKSNKEFKISLLEMRSEMKSTADKLTKQITDLQRKQAACCKSQANS